MADGMQRHSKSRKYLLFPFFSSIFAIIKKKNMHAIILLSGGVGSRMGDNIPKQYIEVGGQPIIAYPLDTISKRSDIGLLVVVAAREWQANIEQLCLERGLCPHFAEPGSTRQHSIYNALKVASKTLSATDLVLIHDAARPLVSNQLIDTCFDACNESEGCLPVLPVKDTIYMSRDGHSIDALLDRSTLFAGQAPECFVFGKYLEAHDKRTPQEISAINGSTEIAHQSGMKVKLVKGEPMNFKITTMEDLETFKTIIAER